MAPIKVSANQAQSINLYKNIRTKVMKPNIELLILIINICCVYWMIKLTYIIAKHSGMALIKAESNKCAFNFSILCY
jgi:hypothetical protein